MEAAAIARLLPEIYRETLLPGSPLDAALSVIEGFITPPERIISGLDAWFDPRRTPDDFLVLIANWIALSPYVGEADFDASGGRGPLSIDPGNLRELVDRGAAFARQRGTAKTLIQMLEIATGVPGFAIQDNPPGEDGRAQPFAFRVVAPAGARSMGAIISRIVEREKPAFATAEIVFAGEGQPGGATP